MKYFKQILIIAFAALLFIVVQYLADFSRGALDWFFTNLPKSQTPADYPVMNALRHPLSSFIMEWLPMTCLAFSILLFMSHKPKMGFLLIALPLVPAIISISLFFKAAQMHVAPGESLIASGVTIGEKPSYILSQEKENAD